MKSRNEEKTQRDRGRRAKKRIHQSPQIAIPEAAELPEPPVLPDVFTKDRSSIHPTRKQLAKPPSKKSDDREK
jgi:hypothetical protein